MIEVGKYNRENTNTDFNSNLVVEGVVLELQSLSSLLKIFKKSSIVNLTTEALKPLLLLLNRYQSRRLYFRDCSRLRSQLIFTFSMLAFQNRFCITIKFSIIFEESSQFLLNKIRGTLQCEPPE